MRPGCGPALLALITKPRPRNNTATPRPMYKSENSWKWLNSFPFVFDPDVFPGRIKEDVKGIAARSTSAAASSWLNILRKFFLPDPYCFF
jgi:hypothetical protein